MNHDDAIRCQAAERYVAGELPLDDCNAFEEHFFDCPECAEEVRWEHIFAANARAAMLEPTPLSAWEKLTAWFRARPALALSMAGNLALLLGGVYLTTGVIPQAGMQARLFSPPYFVPPPAKGMEQPLPLPSGSSFFPARFLVPDPPSSSYYYQIFNASGKSESAGTVQTPDTNAQELFLELPVKKLPAGVHRLEIRNKPGGEIVAQCQFSTSR